jgi:hypothetical protein
LLHSFISIEELSISLFLIEAVHLALNFGHPLEDIVTVRDYHGYHIIGFRVHVDENVGNSRGLSIYVFDVLRGDEVSVLEFLNALHAVLETESTVGEDRGDITETKPTIRVEDFTRDKRLPEVAAEDRIALDHYLSSGWVICSQIPQFRHVH